MAECCFRLSIRMVFGDASPFPVIDILLSEKMEKVVTVATNILFLVLSAFIDTLGGLKVQLRSFLHASFVLTVLFSYLHPLKNPRMRKVCKT